ncbi:MAG: hypothetical protein KAJ14_04035, partial [Candidatus Omnitrophica bacterium]|nr:hypothetical protein [Candidatus Omnitrophota bacterium]
ILIALMSGMENSGKKWVDILDVSDTTIRMMVRSLGESGWVIKGTYVVTEKTKELRMLIENETLSLDKLWQWEVSRYLDVYGVMLNKDTFIKTEKEFYEIFDILISGIRWNQGRLLFLNKDLFIMAGCYLGVTFDGMENIWNKKKQSDNSDKFFKDKRGLARVSIEKHSRALKTAGFLNENVQKKDLTLTAKGEQVIRDLVKIGMAEGEFAIRKEDENNLKPYMWKKTRVETYLNFSKKYTTEKEINVAFEGWVTKTSEVTLDQLYVQNVILINAMKERGIKLPESKLKKIERDDKLRRQAEVLAEREAASIRKKAENAAKKAELAEQKRENRRNKLEKAKADKKRQNAKSSKKVKINKPKVVLPRISTPKYKGRGEKDEEEKNLRLTQLEFDNLIIVSQLKPWEYEEGFIRKGGTLAVLKVLQNENLVVRNGGFKVKGWVKECLDNDLIQVKKMKPNKRRKKNKGDVFIEYEEYRTVELIGDNGLDFK